LGNKVILFSLLVLLSTEMKMCTDQIEVIVRCFRCLTCRPKKREMYALTAHNVYYHCIKTYWRLLLRACPWWHISHDDTEVSHLQIDSIAKLWMAFIRGVTFPTCYKTGISDWTHTNTQTNTHTHTHTQTHTHNL